MMNYKEAPNAASQAEQQKFATGIARIASLAEELHSQGLLPEVFAPEPFRLHPSLEGKVRIETLTIGGKSKKELLRDLGRKHVNIGSYAESMVESGDFTTLSEPQPRELVIGSVGDLVPNPRGTYATTEEIWAVRDEKGLEPVPAETALDYLLQNGDKLQLGDVIWMSMKTIADRRSRPRVFGVGRGALGLWLYGRWTKPSHGWDPEGRFAFSLPASN